MQNYYKQFYPEYDFGNSTQARHRRHVPKSVVPLVQPPIQSMVGTQSSQRFQQPLNFPGLPVWPTMPQSQMGQHAIPQMPDYAAYYYQYYFGALAASNGWPMPMGRTTPKFFIEPHIRATLTTPGLLIQVTSCYQLTNQLHRDTPQLITCLLVE